MTESPRSDKAVNSRGYWEDRFASNWATLGGREQSREFMTALIKFLPAEVYEEIAVGQLSLLDCGCAEGDGTAVLAAAFSRSPVAGFDFSAAAISSASRRFPTLDFFVATFRELGRAADVLISSNCFEHLEDAASALSHLVSNTRRYLLLLVPFLERFPQDPEHVRVVHTATFPCRVDGWDLAHRILVPPLSVWPQSQLLMIYRPEAREGAKPRGDSGPELLLLEGLVANTLASLENIEAAQSRRHEDFAAHCEAHWRDSAARLDHLEERSRSRDDHRTQWQAEFAASWNSWRDNLDVSWRQERETWAAFARRAEAARTEIADEALALRSTSRELVRHAEALDCARQELASAVRLAEQREVDKQRAVAEKELVVSQQLAHTERLAMFEGSAGVRLVLRFWSLLAYIMPEGSRRRTLYRALRRLPGQDASPSYTTDKTSEPVNREFLASDADPACTAPLDPWAEFHQFEEQVRAAAVARVALIFAPTQLRDDEGQRTTQLALDFARRGTAVVFVYWRWERGVWCQQTLRSKGIFQLPIDLVTEHPEHLADAFRGIQRTALFAFPHPSFFATLAALNAAGWITVYDVPDDWEEFHRVGQAPWYDQEFERHVLTATDAVFAVSSILADRLLCLGATAVEVVPNGVVEGIAAVRARPTLGRGAITVGYFGYLAGAWFDWRLLAAAAVLEPTWRFYLIGYGGSPEGVRLAENIVLLGKCPQRELAAYAANWDVAIVPFKQGTLAAAADPIKTYEYLAMGLPVVATGASAPIGAEHLVTCAEGVDAFRRAIADAAATSGEGREARREFAAAATWACRLDAILTSIEGGRQRTQEKRVLFASRP